jgi:hypothetical protein
VACGCDRTFTSVQLGFVAEPVIGQRTLQRLSLIPLRAQPDVPFLVGGQDHWPHNRDAISLLSSVDADARGPGIRAFALLNGSAHLHNRLRREEVHLVNSVTQAYSPQEFAAAHELRLFVKDAVAVNRAIHFKVETFEATESFKPARPYQTHLKWSDLAGGEQSTLLVTAPQTVIAEILRAKVETPTPVKPARRPARGRKGSQRMEAFRN